MWGSKNAIFQIVPNSTEGRRKEGKKERKKERKYHIRLM
jgi:hypothetical protein